MLKRRTVYLRGPSILLIALCLATAQNTHSGQPILTKSRISILLRQPTVSTIHRDREGILWIGTQQGLHRFDGVNLTVFDSDLSNTNWIPDSEIKDIAEDYDGNLYVATSAAVLLKWNRQLGSFDTIMPFPPAEEARIARLLASKHGGIWLLSTDGLRFYDPKFENSADWIVNKDLLKLVGSPRDLLEDDSGDLWVAGDRGIVQVLQSQKAFLPWDFNTLGITEKSSVTAFEFLHRSKLIIGTDSGQILIWDRNTQKATTDTQLETTDSVYISQFLAFEDKLLIGTDRGLYATDQSLSYFEYLGEKGDALSNPNISSLFRDGEYIWVGTIDGLDILTFTPFDLFNLKNSGISNDILTFGEDHQGRIWIGTYGGLYLFDDSGGRHSLVRMKFNSDTITDQRIATITAIKSELWLGLIRGSVEIINTVSGLQQSTKFVSSNAGAITKIITNKEGRDALIATYNQGLFELSGHHARSLYETGSLPEKSITVLFRSRTGILLAVSGNRSYQHIPGEELYSEVPFEFGLGDLRPFIYSFAQTPGDDILIGTKDHGLFLWTRNNQLRGVFRLNKFVTNGDLDSSTIYGIELDSEGNVWCSTQNGLVNLDPKGRLVKRFTIADGLQGDDFTLGASFTSKKGLIYFGGINGYNRFDPKEIDIDTSASPMRLTGISLPRQESLVALANLNSLQLNHKDHFVTFQFSVLDYIDADKNQFRYKLENFDTEWIENGTRNTATYTNLPSGNYVFRAQGANSAGIWNREGITVYVEVLPAPWLTWWAYCIYGMTLLFLLWGMHRIYHSYAIDRKSAELAREMFEAENKADDDMQEQLELQDELVQSAYQHNLTTLSLVHDCISIRSIHQPEDVKRKLTESSIRRISALSSLEDCISYQAGGPVANLLKYTDGIFPCLLRGSPVNPETIVTINEVTAMPIPAELASPVSIIIYELLENCFQHAFEQNSPANYIQIRLMPQTTYKPLSHQLELTVSDNGIGVSGRVEDLAREGSGIAITQSIVTKLGGSLNISTNSGTLVSISIPYNY